MRRAGFSPLHRPDVPLVRDASESSRVVRKAKNPTGHAEALDSVLRIATQLAFDSGKATSGRLQREQERLVRLVKTRVKRMDINEPQEMI